MKALGHPLGALVAGLLFGLGLVVSGMTQPQKVLGFLDIFGRFDPSLMLVMVGAIGVHFFAYRWKAGRKTPLFSPAFVVPTRRDVDGKLLLGAAIFGVGWGLGGYCPGPGIVSLPAGGVPALAFVGAMLGGMLLTARVESALARRKHSQPPRAASATTSENTGAQTTGI